MHARLVCVGVGIAAGVAVAPFWAFVPQPWRIAGMAAVLGLLGALMLRDVMDRRRRL